MLIRLATLSDLPDIVRIYNTSIPGRQSTADTEPVSVDDRLDWFSAHDPKRRPIWVLESQGKVAAWVSLQDFYHRPAYHETAEISVYVDPSTHQRGYGRTLVEMALAEAPRLGIFNVLAFVFAHNAPSLKLFGLLGFQQWGYLPGVAEFEGTHRDLVILGRPLERHTTSH